MEKAFQKIMNLYLTQHCREMVKEFDDLGNHNAPLFIKWMQEKRLNVAAFFVAYYNTKARYA